MNLFFRLAWLLLTGRRCAGTTALGPCQTRFRVYPTDLDMPGHVNNGRYLSLMDLARLDMITRGGLTPHLRRLGWFPVVVAETIQFRRSLTLSQSFVIETRVLAWDDQAFVLDQHFTRGGKVIATALVRTCFLSRQGRTIPPREVLGVLGLPAESPQLPHHAYGWNEAQVVGRARGGSPHTATAA